VLKGLDGFAVCRRIKALNSRIKVILLTGSFEAVDEARAKACGTDEFTVKGERYTALISTYHKLVEQMDDRNGL
jgi:CheY-like chemotaxis protein